MATRFALTDDSITSNGQPVEIGIANAALTLGDRDGFDRRLDNAFGRVQLRRISSECETAIHQALAMREMLDGNWAAAEDAIATIERVGGHAANFALVCFTQRAWIAREIGDVEAQYQRSVAFYGALPHFPAGRARLVADAAEVGHADMVRGTLDELAPNDLAAVGRAMQTTIVLGSLAWAIVTVEATTHAAVLRRLLGEDSGLMARLNAGTLVMCSYDRFLAGLAAVDGDHDEADRLLRRGGRPGRSTAVAAARHPHETLVGTRPRPSRRTRPSTSTPRRSPRLRGTTRHARRRRPNRRRHLQRTVRAAFLELERR